MSEAKRDIPGIIGSAVFIVAGGLAIYFSSEFSVLGSVFPRTIAAVMIVLSVVYIVVASLGHESPPEAQPGSTPRRLLLAITMLAWAFLIEELGFLTTSIAAYAAILVIANYDRWTPRMAVAYTAVGAGVIGVLYGVFRFVLQVPFPSGILV